MNSIKYIADESHYKDVLSLVGKAKRTVWIGTADIKDLYVDDNRYLAHLTYASHVDFQFQSALASRGKMLYIPRGMKHEEMLTVRIRHEARQE